MGYLVNLAVAGRPAVVVGGGAVAARKVEDLLAAKASVTVIAPEPCPQVRAQAEEGRIFAYWREYRVSDLDGAFLVIAATDDEAVNAQVARDAQARGVLVNVVDRPALCSFTLPATVRRGDLTLGVATEGRCPALAGVIREALEQQFGPEYEELVALAGSLRGAMMACGWDGRRIRQAIAGLYHDHVIQLIAAGDRRALAALLRRHVGEEIPLPAWVEAENA